MMRGAWLVVLALAACKTPSQERFSDLKSSVDAYNEAVRWKYFERAAFFRPQEIRGAYLSASEDEGASLHVEDVRVLGVDLRTKDEARVTVRVRYLKLPSVTVQNTTVVQTWSREDRRWLLQVEDPPLIPLDPDFSASAPEDGADFGGGAAEDDTVIEVEDPWGDG